MNIYIGKQRKKSHSREVSEEKGAVREGDSWGRVGRVFRFQGHSKFRKDSMPEVTQRIRERTEKESLGLTIRKKNPYIWPKWIYWHGREKTKFW